MSSLLLIAPLAPDNRAVTEFCASIEAAMKTLSCRFQRIHVEVPLQDPQPWWQDGLPSLCALHDGVVVVTHADLADAGHSKLIRELLSRMPVRTTIWVADGSCCLHGNSIFHCALRQEMNVFVPLSDEVSLSLQLLEFLNFVHFKRQAE